MTAPSNANTSGLEVVAWDSDVLDTFSGFSSNVLTRKPHVAKTGERVRSQAALVTAASAQARIDAAEARADRLANAINDIENVADSFCDDSADLLAGQIRIRTRAALQRETQP